MRVLLFLACAGILIRQPRPLVEFRTEARGLVIQQGIPIRNSAAQQPDGTFLMELGVLWSRYPSRVVSYHDAKSVVA